MQKNSKYFFKDGFVKLKHVETNCYLKITSTSTRGEKNNLRETFNKIELVPYYGGDELACKIHTAPLNEI